MTRIGVIYSAVIGQPAKQVFDNFPIPIKLYTHVSYARAAITLEGWAKVLELMDKETEEHSRTLNSMPSTL